MVWQSQPFRYNLDFPTYILESIFPATEMFINLKKELINMQKEISVFKVRDYTMIITKTHLALVKDNKVKWTAPNWFGSWEELKERYPLIARELGV